MGAGQITTCNGKINIGNGKIATNNCQPCTSGGGGGNPCTNAASSIAIVGYSDTMIAVCADQTNAVAGDCVWDGTFQFFARTCSYSNAQCFAGGPCFDCSFNGKRMWEFEPPGESVIWYGVNSQTGAGQAGWFTMQITGQNGQNSGEVVWEGTMQNTNGTFAGTYTKTGGCGAGPATLTLG
ncbi:MAG: hypothetical protein M0Z50_04685 [Planctomycetia bacterium]|nr:hypothetical protein [Planctomycetia bacterium]